MGSRGALARIVILLPLAGGLSSCLDDCGGGIASCIPQHALTVTVTASGTGGPVGDATIDVTGALTTTIPCRTEGASTVCRVYGGFGTYQLEIKAPGFRNERRTATVGGDIGECGCLIVATQSLQVVLVPSP